MNIREMPWEVIAVFGGLQAVLTGLVGFLGKMWLGRALQSQKAKIEAMVAKSLFMEKVRFNTEFKIYSQLWEKVADVDNALADMSFSGVDKQSPMESSFAEKRKKYHDSVTRLRHLIQSKRPFYSNC